MQALTSQINLSEKVKGELNRRKLALNKRIGRKVSFDAVIRNMLGWS